MERRDFLKLALMSALAGGVAVDIHPAGARGIPAAALPGFSPEKSYKGPPTGVIGTTLTELFKIGPGPSSSHTVAPLRIANNFLAVLEGLPEDALRRGARIEARLYGSLSATGKGHRTDRAILAGLMGQKPETCDTRLMDELQDPARKYVIAIRGVGFELSGATIVWDRHRHEFPYANTVVMRLLAADGAVVCEREYYSTGGGFFAWKGQPAEDRGAPLYPYGSMTRVREIVRESGKSLDEIMVANEMAIRGVGEREINAHLDQVLETMEKGVRLGLSEEGLLPAPFEFYRKAKLIYERSLKAEADQRFMGLLSSYALAVSEGNAAGRLAVTAPTLGSAGTMPAIVYYMRNHLKLPRDAMRRGLLAGGLIGFLCKNNASVAGAEVGCQGEIGVASAMAAAMLAHATGSPFEVTEIAATIALEHHLGMTCDPVGGYVLLPCIERNAFGAVKAYNAWLIAKSELVARHWEDLDRVIAAMLETGRAMAPEFRETGQGGLATAMVSC
ncbi:L-serine ammonia-lyase [Anaeroselena agilis]|uniref:L-serine ammonia-lyase n=1 Tax=Anaeroselena agilis TaxID=3063788 RepID=A0ABU3P1X3_9FIRM|nr:L-serine ammonia-lyase [Selenomonadales bacterium 4137-cl]